MTGMGSGSRRTLVAAVVRRRDCGALREGEGLVEAGGAVEEGGGAELDEAHVEDADVGEGRELRRAGLVDARLQVGEDGAQVPHRGDDGGEEAAGHQDARDLGHYRGQRDEQHERVMAEHRVHRRVRERRGVSQGAPEADTRRQVTRAIEREALERRT